MILRSPVWHAVHAVCRWPPLSGNPVTEWSNPPPLLPLGVSRQLLGVWQVEQSRPLVIDARCGLFAFAFGAVGLGSLLAPAGAELPLAGVFPGLSPGAAKAIAAAKNDAKTSRDDGDRVTVRPRRADRRGSPCRRSSQGGSGERACPRRDHVPRGTWRSLSPRDVPPKGIQRARRDGTP